MKTQLFLTSLFLLTIGLAEAQVNFLRTYEPQFSRFGEIVSTNDNNFIICKRRAVDTVGGLYYPELWKVDIYGDPVWIHSFSDDTSGVLYHLTDLTDGTFQVIKSDLTDGANILHFNSDGVFLDTFALDIVSEYNHGLQTWLPDGDGIWKTSDDYTLGDTEFTIKLYRLTPAGDTVWTLFFESADWGGNYRHNLVPLEDGFLICRVEDFYLDPDLYWDSRVLESTFSKYTNDGEFLWTQVDSGYVILNGIADGIGGFYAHLGLQRDSLMDEIGGFAIAHYDDSGEIIWKKDYYDEFNNYYPGFFKHDAGFDLFGLTSFGTWGDEFVKMYRFDLAGDTIAKIPFESSEVVFTSYAARRMDGGYMLTGSYKYGPLPTQLLPLIIGLDSTGTLENNMLTGKAYVDADENGIFDGPDVPLKNRIIQMDGSIVWALTDYNGNYTMFNYDTGMVHIRNITDTLEYFSIIPDTGYVLEIPDLTTDYNGMDFRYIADSFLVDLSTEVLIDLAHPAIGVHGYIVVENKGSLPALNTHIQLQNDTLYTGLHTSYPAIEEFNEDFSEWVKDSIPIFSTAYVHFEMDIPYDFDLLGDTIHAVAEVWSLTDDYTPLNNSDTTFKVISAAYDPNRITAEPAGATEWGYVNPGLEALTYLIEFQNTGNDTADLVILIDTLPAELNLESFNMLSASHSYEIEMQSNGMVKWIFNNIQLPDSTTNEAESKGFVLYNIELQPGLPIGTSFGNTAEIYFDTNPPIITNTARTTLQEYVPQAISDPQPEDQLVLFPNPAVEWIFVESVMPARLRILDMTGMVVMRSNLVSGLNRINIRQLPAGSYLVEVNDERGMRSAILQVGR